MNIYDVSRRAGVSIATTSRVINGSPKVSEKTRQKVLTVIAECGYTPNAFARGLGLNSMKTVGILCADSSDPYLAVAIYHIERGLRNHNYAPLLICTGYVHENKRKSLELLMSKRVDGVIMVGSNYIESDDTKNDYIRQAASQIPLIIVNGVLDNDNIYSTVCDDQDAIYLMTNKFITAGLKNILYLYNSSSYSALRKFSGYKKALEYHDMPLKRELTVLLDSGNKSVHGVKDILSNLWDDGLRFDGVITSDDILGISVMKFAKEKSICVPDLLFVSGFNNFYIAECCDPELTSIDNSLELICNHSVATLMGLFAGGEMPKATVFAPKIIERGTTKFID